MHRHEHPVGRHPLSSSVDSSYRFTRVSPEAAALWDWPERLLIGQLVRDVFPAMREGEPFVRHEAAMATRTAQAYAAYAPRQPRWYTFNLHPLDDGGILCVFDESGSRPPR